MAKVNLYDKHLPACTYCRYGIGKGEAVLCEYNGVVDKNYKCRRFKYDPVKRVPTPPQSLPKYDIEDFRID